MKKLIILSSFLVGITISSCGDDENCKECVNCKTKANRTLCEDDFEKTSNFNDEVAVMLSDGCTCTDK